MYSLTLSFIGFISTESYLIQREVVGALVGSSSLLSLLQALSSNPFFSLLSLTSTIHQRPFFFVDFRLFPNILTDLFCRFVR